MTVSYAIEGYLNFIKDSVLSDFSDIVLSGFVYDESLEFNARASSFIRKQIEFQKAEGTPVTDWAFIVWNRSNLGASFTSRPQVVTIDTTDDDIPDSKATMKMGTLEIELKVFTNNVEVGEYIEEYLHVLSGELVSFEANYVEYGETMRCSADPTSATTFEKEELAEVGSTIGIGITSTIHYIRWIIL